MIKSFTAIVAVLCVFASVAFAALLTSTPVAAATSAPASASPAASTASVDVFETSAVLVLAKPAKPARKVARKAKAWTCGDWEASAVGGAYKRCEWR